MALPLKTTKEDALPIGAIIGTAEEDLRSREFNKQAYEAGDGYRRYAFHRADVVAAEDAADLLKRALDRFQHHVGQPRQHKPDGPLLPWAKRSMQILSIDLDRIQQAMKAASQRRAD